MDGQYRVSVVKAKKERGARMAEEPRR
jgi:hypothetical protein